MGPPAKSSFLGTLILLNDLRLQYLPKPLGRAQSMQNYSDFSKKLHSLVPIYFGAVHNSLYPLFSQIHTILNVPKKYPLAIHYP